MDTSQGTNRTTQDVEVNDVSESAKQLDTSRCADGGTQDLEMNDVSGADSDQDPASHEDSVSYITMTIEQFIATHPVQHGPVLYFGDTSDTEPAGASVMPVVQEDVNKHESSSRAGKDMATESLLEHSPASSRMIIDGKSSIETRSDTKSQPIPPAQVADTGAQAYTNKPSRLSSALWSLSRALSLMDLVMLEQLAGLDPRFGYERLATLIEDMQKLQDEFNRTREQRASRLLEVSVNELTCSLALMEFVLSRPNEQGGVDPDDIKAAYESIMTTRSLNDFVRSPVRTRSS